MTTQKLKHVLIIITENCNLNCVYCYEKRKNLRVLSFNEIKQIIQNVFHQASGYDGISLIFHGGEIALAFERLKEVCEWLWSQSWEKPYVCFASTNGTLIHGEIQEWFHKNKNRFVLSLSLDGTRDMQNVNRSNSFDQIDLEFFKKCWPKQKCKMTISPLTMPKITEGVAFIHDLGFYASANLACGVEWSKELLSVYREQLGKTAEFYLANPEYKVMNLLLQSIWKIGFNALFPDRRNFKKWCATGEDMVCYASDGRAYPCPMFIPSTHVNDDGIHFPQVDFSNHELFVNQSCKDCTLEYTCPTCYGENYFATGSLNKQPEGLCSFKKVEAVAASYLQGTMLLAPSKYLFTRTLSPTEITCVAKGVEIVQKTLADEVEAY